MDIQGQKEQMLEATETTSWTPQSLKERRFKNIIESAPDWNLSRDRYWATPIPVWKGQRADGTEVIKVIGSYDEFFKLTGKKLDDYHLPNVMKITFEIDGVVLHHIGKVIDCWFESGSMPFAQYHYPFNDINKFENNFPADFIVEAIDQTRGWFYSMMAVNVGLFGKAPFKNLICTGFINASDGKKMSKKLKNYTDPLELMDKYSADSFRLLLLQSPLLNGEDFSLSDREVGDVARKLGMIWNMYDFFTLYAEVDGWEWNGSLDDPMSNLTNKLDIWVVSKIHSLAEAIRENTEAYNISSALKQLIPFIDNASNWYVRRSRKRFWKTSNDKDKNDAYTTLHYVLTQLAVIMAPFTPFISEELYRKLTGGESVHLLDWPNKKLIDMAVIESMDFVLASVNDGLSQRAKASIKVRQPLQKVTISGSGKDLANNHHEYEWMIAEELNVKSVEWKTSDKYEVSLDTNITPELRSEGLARDVIRVIQNARKNAGLNVEDKILLEVISEDKDLDSAIKKHASVIEGETLAVAQAFQDEDCTEITETIDSKIIRVRLRKA